MADDEKQKLTAKERQIARINQLKAQLQKEEAKLKATTRKERNDQLMALGLYMEAYLRQSSEKSCLSFKNTVGKYLSDRNLENALAAANRILEEKRNTPPNKEVTLESSPQLTKTEAQGDKENS